MIYHIWFQPTPCPPKALFKFIITRSHAPLWETDYNLHKSNSTYFTDADVARSHLVSAILQRGIRGVGKREGEESTGWSLSTAARRQVKKKELGAIAPLGTSGVDTAGGTSSTPKLARNMTEEEFMAVATQPGNLLIALGSVACFFHREVVPYKQYEIWTRLLTWDRKWMYIVSYFVEAGAFKPEEFFLQPWKKAKTTRMSIDSETTEEKRKRIHGKVLATSLATYVVKKGRLTIPPEVVLQRSDMLPEKPPGAPSSFYVPPKPTTTPNSETNGSVSPPELSSHAETMTAGSFDSILEESLFPETSAEDDGEWTWEKMEKERQRGLKFAQAFDGLNVLREEFDGGDGGVLGVFSDLVGAY